MAIDKQIILITGKDQSSSPISTLKITGASSGVGLDTAYVLAAASPNNHAIMGVRNISKGEKCIQELQQRKPQGTLSLLELDLTSDSSIDAAAKQIEEKFGRIDVLINNAGIAHKRPFPTRADLRAIFETNVFGPAILTHALTPLLKASAAPKIINVTSELGSIFDRSDPTAQSYQVPWNDYRMSKAALNMLTAIQYKEFQEFGCKVWAFCPGFVVTNLSGEEDRQWRVDSGGESSETSAEGILEIVEGKRDAEVGTFITKYGKSYQW
jgi:NAD(P)-dependent dehydrogenase (short-subunit alcohol dehydrogenase family)